MAELLKNLEWCRGEGQVSSWSSVRQGRKPPRVESGGRTGTNVIATRVASVTPNGPACHPRHRAVFISTDEQYNRWRQIQRSSPRSSSVLSLSL